MRSRSVHQQGTEKVCEYVSRPATGKQNCGAEESIGRAVQGRSVCLHTHKISTEQGKHSTRLFSKGRTLELQDSSSRAAWRPDGRRQACSCTGGCRRGECAARRCAKGMSGHRCRVRGRPRFGAKRDVHRRKRVLRRNRAVLLCRVRGVRALRWRHVASGRRILWEIGGLHIVPAVRCAAL